MVETLYESSDQGPQLLDSYSDYLLQAARWQIDSFASVKNHFSYLNHRISN